MRNIIKRVCKWLIRRGPLLLTIASSAGVCAVGYLSAKAAPKAEDAITEAEYESGQELTTKEKIVVGGKYYIPAVATGTLTIGAMVLAYILSENQIKALTATAVAAAGTLQQYRQKVVEKHGEEADKEIMDEINEEHKDFGRTSSKDEVWFFEPYSKQYFRMSPFNLLCRHVDICGTLDTDDSMTLSEYLNALGLKATPQDDDLYWDIEDFRGYGTCPWTDILFEVIQGPAGHEHEEAYSICHGTPFVKYFEYADADGRNTMAYYPVDPDGYFR